MAKMVLEVIVSTGETKLAKMGEDDFTFANKIRSSY